MAGKYLTVEIGGVKYIIDSTTETFKILHLDDPTSLAPNSLKDNKTGTDYQVAAGKTFRMLGIIFVSYTAASDINIYQGDTADAVTSLKMIFTSSITNTYRELPMSIEFAASKFITIDPVIVNALAVLHVLGIEY